MVDDYRNKAVNPQQYDSPELDWRIDGDENAPSRVFFRDHLKPFVTDLAGKSVLDIGSGVGHLFKMLQELGAAEIVGVEPSKRNAETSRKKYPGIFVFEGSLEQFGEDKKFDVAVCVMVFEHVSNIDLAFSKISRLLKERGRLYLIVGDMEFCIQSRPGAEVDAQPLPGGGYATKTVRPNGVMFDIFRPLESYIASAESNGLKLIAQNGLVSNSERHKASAGKPISHLLVFER